MWIFALIATRQDIPEYRTKAIRLVKDIHSDFVIPGRGVHWKMLEDLSAPYPGFGLGSLDPFHGYVVYRLLDEDTLGAEIRQMKTIIERTYRDLVITQDLGLGMMLWMTCFFPEDVGHAFTVSGVSRYLTGCGSIRRAISAVSWECLRSNLHSQILASLSASRPLRRGRSASRD